MEQSTGTPTGTARTWSTRSLVVLTLTALALTAATAWHLSAVFLHLAPANSVSVRYHKQIDGYIYPEFEQDWQLFAPNPPQENIAVDARIRTLGEDASRHTWPWTGLTAQDIAHIRHNPIPSHADQNLLPHAWSLYTDWHRQKSEAPIGTRGMLSTDYLKRIALQRFGPKPHGEQVIEVQLRSRTSVVPPPRWSDERVRPGTSYRILPWWSVAEADYKGL